MLKTRLISSQEKPFIDDIVEQFPAFDRVTVLGGEKLSCQLVYMDQGEPYAEKRGWAETILSGTLAPFTSMWLVGNVPVERPVVPGRTDDQYVRMTPGLYPDVLMGVHYKGKVKVSREKLHALWLEVQIPETLCGEQELTVTLSLPEGIRVTQQLQVNVIRAVLPEQKTLFTQWFYCDGLASWYDVEPWSERHWEIVENFARVAAERGRNMLYTPLLTPALNTDPGFERIPTQLVEVTRTNGEYTYEFARVDRWIDMCDRIGIKYLEISHFYHQDHAKHSAKVYGTVDGVYRQIFGWDTLALDPEYQKFLRGLVAAFVAHLKARGDDKRCYYHISDEPGLECLEHYKAVKEAIVDLIAEYPIMDALSDYEFYKTGALPLPVPTTQDAHVFVENGVEKLWVYYACNQVVDYSNCYLAMPYYRTRSLGMQLYKYKIAGFLHWGYNYYNNAGSGDCINPYLDLSGEDWVPAGDTFMVYPERDGTPLLSTRMLSLEEAFQDIRAMELCERYYSHEEVVAAMEEILGEEITFLRCAHSAEEMLAVRARINEMIEKALRQ